MFRRIRVPLCAVAVLVLSLGGCAESTGVNPARSVRISALPGVVRVENLLTESIYSRVMGREQAALASWFPCVEPSICGEVSAGRQLVVPDPNTGRPLGAPREREAIVFWWVAVRDDAGNRVVGPVQSVVVELW